MNNSDGHTRAIIAAAYFTGMRRGEILLLTWDKVDLKNRIIRLGAGDTKDREARDIPICKELLKIFLAMPNRIHDIDQCHYVFQYGGKPVKDIRDGLKKACKAAGIKYGRAVVDGFIFHDLRHTYNTNMRKAGVPDSVIMAITGHSTREMFDRYNTVDLDDARKAVDQFENHLEFVDRSVDQMQKKSPSKEGL